MAKKKSNGLLYIREKAGVSQDELASLSGITKKTIQNIEHRGGKPTLRTLEALAKALKVPVAMLI